MQPMGDLVPQSQPLYHAIHGPGQINITTDMGLVTQPEEESFLSEYPATFTDVSLGANRVTKKTENKVSKNHIVPSPPGTPPEHIVNTQNETAQELEPASTLATCESGKSRSHNRFSIGKSGYVQKYQGAGETKAFNCNDKDGYYNGGETGSANFEFHDVQSASKGNTGSFPAALGKGVQSGLSDPNLGVTGRSCEKKKKKKKKGDALFQKARSDGGGTGLQKKNEQPSLTSANDEFHDVQRTSRGITGSFPADLEKGVRSGLSDSNLGVAGSSGETKKVQHLPPRKIKLLQYPRDCDAKKLLLFAEKCGLEVYQSGGHHVVKTPSGERVTKVSRTVKGNKGGRNAINTLNKYAVMKGFG